MKKLGLVGGISWVSTVDYYRFINEGINQKLGGLDFAELLIYSINFNEFQKNNTAGNWEASYNLLLNAAQSLKNGGVDAIILCANTAHIMADRLEAELKLPLINVIAATADEILKLGLKKVGLLGTKFTMEMDFYKDKLTQLGVQAIIPNKQEDRDFIQATLRDELGKGILKAETKAAYIAIMNELIEQGAEGIILGCTEIPLFISQRDVSVPVFDTTKIHSQAAIKYALGEF